MAKRSPGDWVCSNVVAPVYMSRVSLVYLHFLSISCVSVASGTWSFSRCPLMLAQTSCLRRVLTTSPQRSPHGELLPCCPRPRSSPCSSTPLTGPTAGIRYTTHTEYIQWLTSCVIFNSLQQLPVIMLHLCIDLYLIEFFIQDCVWISFCKCGVNEIELSIRLSGGNFTRSWNFCLSLFD